MAPIDLKYSKLKGSTLVETLVAFTVLLICVSMAATIITCVGRSSNKFDYLEAWITLQNLASETIRNKDFTDTEIAYNHFRIRRSVEPSSYTPSVYILVLKVVDPDNRVRLCNNSLILPDHDH
jgi:hypothetical protein